MRISDWSSDVCSSDLHATAGNRPAVRDHRLHPALALLEADHRLPPDLAAQAQEAAGQFLHEAEVVHRVPDIGIEHRPLEDRCEARLELPQFLRLQIGRASWRERVCPYVSISVVAVSLKKKKK